MQISRSKPDSLHRTPAGFTALALDGYGLCDILPARPTSAASYPVSVRRVATLLHASFRQSLAVLPLRFASASPPSGCTGDLHPQNCRTCPTHRTLRAGSAGAAAFAAASLTAAARGALPEGRSGRRDGRFRSNKGMLLIDLNEPHHPHHDQLLNLTHTTRGFPVRTRLPAGGGSLLRTRLGK